MGTLVDKRLNKSIEKKHTKYYLTGFAAYMYAGTLWLTEAKKSVSFLSQVNTCSKLTIGTLEQDAKYVQS